MTSIIHSPYNFDRYVNERTLVGSIVGGLGGFGFIRALFSKSSFLQSLPRSRALPLNAFFTVAGLSAGFAISSDKAIINYYKSNFPIENNSSSSDSNWTSNDKKKVVFLTWASSITGIMAYNWNRANLHSVHKFGYARLASQAITVIAILTAFALDDEMGIYSGKYNNRAIK
jgi:hypothetical protein